MTQNPNQLDTGEEPFGLNRRRVLQGIAATSALSVGSVGLVGTAAATGCECSEEASCDVTVPLCAGQTMDVGDVSVQVVNTEDGLEFEVRYQLDEGYELEETHLYVGKTCPEELSSSPGQFPYSATYDSGVSADTYRISFDDICDYELKNADKGNGKGKKVGGKWEKAGNCGFLLGQCVFIAAHAVVSKTGDDDWEETAWGDGCDGQEFADGGNWATYFSYTSSFCDVFPKTIFVGYEDLPLEFEKNDYDYNDFLVSLDTTFDAQQVGSGGTFDVNKITMEIVPRARGADYTHEFYLKFLADTLCDGEYTLTVKDENDNVVGTPTTNSFSGSSDETIHIFNTADAFPTNQTNTRPGVACEDPQRTAELVITFDDPCEFNLDDVQPTLPHGSGLFFDPYIVVDDTVETISAGDIRLLTVPSSWRWPEERAAIWDVYDEVDEDSDGKPVFTTDTWFNGAFDASLFADCSGP